MRRLGLSLLCFVLWSLALIATEQDDTLAGSFGFYLQRDQPNHTGGNPELDEDEFVFEGILMLDKSLSDRDRLGVKVVGDIISSASQARLHNPQYRALQSPLTKTTRRYLCG